ncbi:hypothetical protein ACPOM7_02265 [Peribacillus castrilensis]|uniref:hypothetical protein n=1 Tax=Peribacillus TaxID=2675229 RepID=UPI0030FBB292
MKRRNFIKNFLLFVFAFIFGYTVKKEGENTVLVSKGNDSNSIAHEIEELTGQSAKTAQRTKNNLSISEFEEYVVNGDWAPAINKAFSLYNDKKSPFYQKRIRIKFDSDVIYTIKSTINFNPKWVEWDARGSKIKTKGMGTNGFLTALKVNTGDTYATNNNIQAVNLGIFIEGEGQGIIGSKGVLITNCADFMFIGMRSQNFESAIYFSSNAYILSFLHCVFVGEYAIHIPGRKTNYGERLTFIDCSFGGAYSVLNNSNQGSLHMKSCSFDFNKKGIVKSTNGVTFMDACHFEFHNDQMIETPFQVSGNGATLIVKGGWLLNTGSNTPLNSYMVEGDGYSLFEDIKMHNLRTTTRQFASDLGVHEVIIGNTNNQHGFSLNKIQKSHNSLMDGGFEADSIIDLIWISRDTGTITDRWNSTNMKLELDTTNYKSGNKSLKVSKNTGVNNAARFVVAFPLSRFDHKRKYPFIEWNIAKLNTAGNGGSIEADFNWANLSITSDIQAPKILKSQYINSSSTISIGVAKQKDWIKVTSTGDSKIVYNPPRWATHLLVEFNLISYDGNQNNAFLNFDDLFFEMV